MKRKIIILLLAFAALSGCASHKYIVSDPATPHENEYRTWKVFVVLGLIPVDNDLNQRTVCPDRRIYSLNLYDSGLDGAICGLTLSIFCPHTVGIECTESGGSRKGRKESTGTRPALEEK